jgi:DNA-directed RNA polymerase specialized sigma24 family protein
VKLASAPSASTDATVTAAAGECAQVFLAQLTFLRSLVAQIARRQRLAREEAEDFESFVRLRLLENDYRILRSHDGRGELRSYLTVVVHRLFLDYRNQQWGKWRTSSAARRLGGVAQALEALVHRDGLPLEEAIRRLEADVPREDLRRLLAELPAPKRLRLRYEPESQGDDVADGHPSPEESALGTETAGRARAALTVAFRRLTAGDRLLLRLHFAHALTVAAIARTQQEEAGPLYRRIRKLLKQIARELARAGVRGDDVESLLASPALADWQGFDPHPAHAEGRERDESQL